MRSTIISTLFVLAAATVPASAQDPKTEACELAEAFAGGIDVTIGQLLKLASLWPDSDRAKLEAVFRPELKGFNLGKGKVYRIADFGELAQEFLIVSADLKQAQNLYFRVIFQTYEGGHFFKNVKFNTDFYKISDPAFAQPPELVDCG